MGSAGCRHMPEADVAKIKSLAVRKAYHRARVRTMPREFKQAYLLEVAKYGGYAKELEHVKRETAERVDSERETAERVERRVLRKIVTQMLDSGMTEAQVATILKKTEDEIYSILA